MLSMMDAQMRTVSEGGGGQFGAWTRPRRASRRRPRRNEQFSRPRRRRPRSNEQFRRPWRRRPRSNEQFRRPQKRARRRRSRLRSRRSSPSWWRGACLPTTRRRRRFARRDRRRVSRSADEPTSASTSYVYLKVLASSLDDAPCGAHSRPIAPRDSRRDWVHFVLVFTPAPRLPTPLRRRSSP